jgi:hypothetical protein
MQEYNLPPGSHFGWEVDHLIPLCRGGADDDRNLWPQPRRSLAPIWNAERKDVLEARECQLACSGEIDLREAQKEISDDWIEAYQRRIGEPR